MTLGSEQQPERVPEGMPSLVELDLDGYTFIEKEGSLRVVWPRDSLGCAFAFSVGLVAVNLAVLYFMLPTNWSDVSWWQLIPAALAVLGLGLLARTIRHWREPASASILRRTYWLFDKESGNVYRQGKFHRTMSSITHIGIVGMEDPLGSSGPSKGGVVYYVWFAPYQGYAFTPSVAPGMVQGQIVFMSMKGASQAATLLANFLGVEVVSQQIK